MNTTQTQVRSTDEALSVFDTLKLALEALKDNQHLVADNERHAYVMEYNSIIEKCEKALAQQPQNEVRGLSHSNEQVEPVAFLYQTSFYQPDKDDGMRLSFNIGTAEVNAMPDTIKPLFPHPPVPTAQPEQEEKLPPVEIGVDVTKEGTAVTAFYRRPNDVMEMFYSEFHPLAQPKEPEQEHVADREVLRLADAIELRVENKAERMVIADKLRKLAYTTPPQRTWEGLSVFEINDLVENTEYEDYRDLVERTEAKLKAKNSL